MGILIRVSGAFACFSRPENPVESQTYDVVTPSASRGIFENIYWKPEMRWVIDGIYVLKPIKTASMMKNCIKNVINLRNVLKQHPVDVSSMRDQRNATILVDVEYAIRAHIIPDNGTKHIEIFRRRMKKGQYFRHPWLGRREYGVDLLELINKVPPIPEELKGEKNLGVMLHSIDYKHGERPLFFDAVLKDGYLDIPPVEDKRRVR